MGDSRKLSAVFFMCMCASAFVLQADIHPWFLTYSDLVHYFWTEQEKCNISVEMVFSE